MKHTINWSLADWAMNDAAIARAAGCTREAVRLQRSKLGIARSPRFRCRAGSARERIATMDTPKMTLKQIAREVGCSVSHAYQCVAGNGKGYMPEFRRGRPKYDWSKADWTQTDKQVAAALGIGNHGVVSQYRFRHNIWKRGEKANVAAPVQS